MIGAVSYELGFLQVQRSESDSHADPIGIVPLGRTLDVTQQRRRRRACEATDEPRLDANIDVADWGRAHRLSPGE
jgi:hypothetical protein